MTSTLKIKGDRYYAVINYKENGEYKQKWISLGLPVRNNKRKAEAMLDEIKRNYADSYSTPSGDMLFTTYISKWLYAKKPFIELSTWEGYQIYAERHIIPYFEPLHLSLREVKSQHIKEYYKYKYCEGRLDGKPGGLSIPSIKKHSIVLKEVLQNAVEDDLIIKNPASGVKLPAKEVRKRDRVFLTAEQANCVLQAFEGHPLQAVVYITLYYGLRRSEILGLRWSAVDFEHNTLTINHTVVKNRTIVHKDTTKTECSYCTYPLIEDVKVVLLRERERQIAQAKLFGRTYKESDYIFTWEDGTLFRPDYVTRGFQRVLKRNGLPHMRFHDLRHSTASIIYDKGWDIKAIQTWLRHSSIEVTSDIYTHITEARNAQMADDLNEVFKISKEEGENEQKIHPQHLKSRSRTQGN